ncbi:Wzz/FepE/Etk N-terminal domain-containing protein [Paenalcaligenes niemegkensis]|uniref:LPS O-antigen chain length determinant protein WzzB n=1 Tax=Paenalcaligenes niemegkensis TaxID=2895469 RepID=UPI001EE8D32F|nr:Wzz/FepE/Etk N-terminal domain-containing protein [Paenalcaligenes niemegkensis]MCQ9617459.1 Wzz/FepE/Etk N-terminal domain-containing protein [Paenalcaligenes niemegkensis]
MSELPLRNTRHDDEIDLVQLFQKLWKGRIILVLFFFAGLALSAIYALTTKEQWTSVAYVSSPRLEQISAYLDQRRAMARVTGNQSIDTKALSSSLFNSFVAQAAISRNQWAYLGETDYYKQQTTDDSIANHRLLIDLADQLHIKVPDKNEIAQYYQLSFGADTAEQAQKILTGYLDWVNNLSFNQVDEEFNDQLNAQILSRQTELNNIDFKLATERQHSIENIENALHTAKLADIKDYAVARQTEGATIIELSDSRRLFMLGEKYLSAELETRQEAPLIYPPNYYEIKRELAQLEPLRDYKIDALSYFTQRAPTLPLSHDKPKRVLIVALGGMLGGCWVSYGSFCWRYSDEQTRQEYLGTKKSRLP